MTSDIRMYNTVHTASDASMPIGMSRCGFFASCAAVDTASNPMYAKNTTAAARTTPVQPNSPNLPVAAGTNGAQFDDFTYMKPKPITRNTIASFTNTMTLLNRADSLIPITSSVVTIASSTIAGTLITPDWSAPCAAEHTVAADAAPSFAAESALNNSPFVAGFTHSMARAR